MRIQAPTGNKFIVITKEGETIEVPLNDSFNREDFDRFVRRIQGEENSKDKLEIQTLFRNLSEIVNKDKP